MAAGLEEGAGLVEGSAPLAATGPRRAHVTVVAVVAVAAVPVPRRAGVAATEVPMDVTFLVERPARRVERPASPLLRRPIHNRAQEVAAVEQEAPMVPKSPDPPASRHPSTAARAEMVERAETRAINTRLEAAVAAAERVDWVFWARDRAPCSTNPRSQVASAATAAMAATRRAAPAAFQAVVEMAEAVATVVTAHT
jgi:hypothetical protein